MNPQEDILCDKVTYKTFKEGQKAIKPLAKKHNTSYRVYKCPECGEFHIYTVGKKKHKATKEKNTMKEMVVNVPTGEKKKKRAKQNKGVPSKSEILI